MSPHKHQPIGVFDSGIGGLTVAHAIAECLPHEAMIYFGDTAHLPYGDKSEAAIQAYSIKIADVLLSKGCKVIVIACNSASSAAYLLLKEYVGRRARVVNVIDPMVELVGQQFAGKNVGLIGTKRTVQSGIYEKKIQELGLGIHLHSLATPLLVPMIEEGFINNHISEEIIANYLHDPLLEGIEALILGCTHYPLIRQQMETFYKGKVTVLDSSVVVAQRLKEVLEAHDLVAPAREAEPDHHFLVSDYTDSFEASTRHFFTKRVHLEKCTLWE
jgi:glutamate racemase